MSSEQAQAVAALQGPQHTLTISVEARARASRQPRPIITDPLAERLTDELDLHADFSGMLSASIITGTAVRTEFLDDQTRAFAEQYPGASVLTIGAGLCTRHDRLAELPVRWVDVDLPAVVAVRQALLPAQAHRTVRSCSAADAAGIADIVLGLGAGRSTAEPVLVVLEGLCMYLTEAVMRDLLDALSRTPAGSRILLEVVGTSAARHSGRNRSLAAGGASFSWGLDDPSELTCWGLPLALASTFYHAEAHRDRWSAGFKLLRQIPAVRRSSKIAVLEVSGVRSPR